MKNAFVSLSVLFLSVTAHAHPVLESTIPEKGTTVSEVPKKVELKFSEDLEPAMSQITVTNSTTKKVVSEKSHIKGEEKNVLEVDLKDIEKGSASYDVSWKAVSKDTHKMKGTFSFKVITSGK